MTRLEQLAFFYVSYLEGVTVRGWLVMITFYMYALRPVPETR